MEPGRRRRAIRHHPDLGRGSDQNTQLGNLLFGDVPLDEQTTLQPFFLGTRQMMDEVGWQGDQMDTQQPDDGPGHRTADSKAKILKAPLEMRAPGDPDCEKGGYEKKGPKRRQTGRGPPMRGFPMGPNG